MEGAPESEQFPLISPITAENQATAQTERLSTERKWSWIPGLPSLGSTLDLWFVDSQPAGKPLQEYDLVFYIYGDTGALAANRTGEPYLIPPTYVLVERATDEKKYMEVDGRRALVREFQLVYEEDLKDSPRTDIEPVPAELVGVTLPPCYLDIH